MYFSFDSYLQIPKEHRSKSPYDMTKLSKEFWFACDEPTIREESITLTIDFVDTILFWTCFRVWFEMQLDGLPSYRFCGSLLRCGGCSCSWKWVSFPPLVTFSYEEQRMKVHPVPGLGNIGEKNECQFRSRMSTINTYFISVFSAVRESKQQTSTYTFV